MPSAPFIVVEALDAGGSQTQTDLLMRKLRREKYEVLPLHFPQEKRATGQFVYGKFLHANNKGKFTRREQALLYIQDFFSRVEDIAAFRKQRGKRVVLTDRFCTSTLAYQTMGLTGSARKKQLAWLKWLCFEDQPALPKPDLVVLVDVPAEVSMRRLAGKQDDFFEKKQRLAAIRNSYLKIALEEGWKVINGVDEQGNERTRQDLHKEIWQIVQPLLS